MARTRVIWQHCMDAEGREIDLWHIRKTDNGFDITFSQEHEHEKYLERCALYYGQYECYCVLLSRSEYEELLPALGKILSLRSTEMKPPAPTDAEPLSGVQRVILLSKIRGLSHQETADENELTLYCVEKTLNRLYRKNGVNSLQKLIREVNRKKLL